jgi:ribosomal protein S27AE
VRVPKTCPRCGDWIPNNHQPGAFPGALSRVDNKTEICSECGSEEAIQQIIDGAPAPMSEWLKESS